MKQRINLVARTDPHYRRIELSLSATNLGLNIQYFQDKRSQGKGNLVI